MALDSRWNRIPTKLQILLGLCVLCVLLLAAVFFFWYLPGPVPVSHTNPTVHVKILAVNDFHGHMTPGQTLNKRPVGSAPVLASYLKSAMASGNADGTIIALPGDVVGASPPNPGCSLTNRPCCFSTVMQTRTAPSDRTPRMLPAIWLQRWATRSSIKGIPELMRKINGGNGTTNITHLVDPYPGAKIDYVCANVVWTANNTPILPPYTLRNVSGVPIAFIGADTMTTPRLQNAANVKGVTFLDEADSINRYIPEIQRQGVHAIVVLLHEGGTQTPYDGPTQANGNVNRAGGRDYSPARPGCRRRAVRPYP